MFLEPGLGIPDHRPGDCVYETLLEWEMAELVLYVENGCRKLYSSFIFRDYLTQERLALSVQELIELREDSRDYWRGILHVYG